MVTEQVHASKLRVGDVVYLYGQQRTVKANLAPFPGEDTRVLVFDKDGAMQVLGIEMFVLVVPPELPPENDCRIAKLEREVRGLQAALEAVTADPKWNGVRYLAPPPKQHLTYDRDPGC